MEPFVIGFAMLAAALALWLFSGPLLDSWSGFVVAVGFVLRAVAMFSLAGGVVVLIENTDGAKERNAASRAQAAAEREPRVVRRVDGCEVYAFKEGGRWHYFTRCPQSKTSTTSTYTVGCGKNCTREESETIEVK